jgi:hypothetical protein
MGWKDSISLEKISFYQYLRLRDSETLKLYFQKGDQLLMRSEGNSVKPNQNNNEYSG